MADSVFFVRKGRVLCQRRGSEDVFPVGEGECFGESALYADMAEDGNFRKADVLSDGEQMLKLLQANPDPNPNPNPNPNPYPNPNQARR